MAVKEFSGDVRRAYEIHEVAPASTSWSARTTWSWSCSPPGPRAGSPGSPTSVTRQCVDLYRAAAAGDLRTAVPLYRDLHPCCAGTRGYEFVQAIKLSMDVAGRNGGACRPPRLPLPPATAAEIRAATEKVM